MDLAELLAGVDGHEETAPATAPPAAPQAEPPGPAPALPSPTIAPRSTRRDQLLTLLRRHDSPLHLEAIARALDIKRGHADEVARQAIKAGLVRRVGSRTGKIELVDAVAVETPSVEAVPKVSPATAPKKAKRSASPTRVDRLVAFLETRPGAVHATEIAEALATTRGNADSAMRAGVRAGLVRRVGSRTGLVQLVATTDPSRPVAEV